MQAKQGGAIAAANRKFAAADEARDEDKGKNSPAQ